MSANIAMDRRSFFALAMGAAATASCGRSPNAPPTVFDGKIAQLTVDLLQAQPEIGIICGVSGADRVHLFDRSPAAMDLYRASSLRRAAQWRGGIARETLGAGERQSFDIIDHHLASAAAASRFPFGRLDPVSGFFPYSTDHLRSACVTLPLLFEAALAGADLNETALHLQRLKAAPAAIDGELGSVRADALMSVVPPALALRRLQSLIAAILAQSAAESVFVSALRERLTALKQASGSSAQKMLLDAETIVANEIFPAYRRVYALIGELALRAREEPSLAQIPDGAACYRVCLASYVDSSPEEIHRAGIARVTALGAQLDMVQRSQGLADGQPAQRLAMIAEDPRFLYPAETDPRSLMIDDMRREINRMAPLLPRVLRAPAMGPLDVVAAETGERPGYAPPSLDGKRNAVLRVETALAVRTPRFALPVLAYQEGLPGRHLAGITTLKAELPVIRKLIPGIALRGGWSSYAGQLADELGAYENAPFARIGYLQAQTLSAASAVVDTGVHAFGWGKDKAAAYLVQSAGVSEAAAETIIADCAVSPGAASAAEAGRREIIRLRERARGALGARFDLRDFHGVVLGGGEIPLSTLAENIETWIAGGGNGRLS